MARHWRRLTAGILASLALSGGVALSTAALPERFGSALTGYLRVGEYWVEQIGTLKENSVELFCEKLNGLRGGTLSGATCWARRTSARG